jgi:hypothetical protein
MIGAIKNRDVLIHPIVTIQCFGWRIFLRSIFAWNKVTFLALLSDTDYFRVSEPESAAIFHRCVLLEEAAGRIYSGFSQIFVEMPSVAELFRALTLQERDHADLLQICCVAGNRPNSRILLTAPLHGQLRRLEERMRSLEAESKHIRSVEDALRLVITMESSEVNELFLSLIVATDSDFVSTLSNFRDAMNTHLNYICQHIIEMMPHLEPECEGLLAKFSWIED